MLILVIGATGTTGSEVVRHLHEKDVRVRLGAHTLGRAAGLVGGNVEAVPFDFYDDTLMYAALEGVDRVYLVTPPAPDGVAMAMRAINAMRGFPIAQVVRLSVFNAEMAPGISVTRNHREVERYIDDSDLPYTFLRPMTFMDNLLGMAGVVRGQNTVFLPTADSRISYVAAQDIGAVAAEVLTQDGHLGKSYDVTGPEALSGYDIAAQMSEVLGRAIQYVPIDDETFRQALTGMSEEYQQQLIELNESYRTGRWARVAPTVAQITGRPATTFRDWLRIHAEPFRMGGLQAA